MLWSCFLQRRRCCPIQNLTLLTPEIEIVFPFSVPRKYLLLGWLIRPMGVRWAHDTLFKKLTLELILLMYIYGEKWSIEAIFCLTKVFASRLERSLEISEMGIFFYGKVVFTAIIFCLTKFSWKRLLFFLIKFVFWLWFTTVFLYLQPLPYYLQVILFLVVVVLSIKRVLWLWSWTVSLYMAFSTIMPPATLVWCPNQTFQPFKASAIFFFF